MKNLDFTLLIVALLLEDANRAQCLKVLEATDGDLRAHAQARLNVLDNMQNDAQRTIYSETPPGMVDSWELRSWWFENYGHANLHNIDFHAISDSKKQEWYAYSNHIIETKL